MKRLTGQEGKRVGGQEGKFDTGVRIRRHEVRVQEGRRVRE